MTPPRPPRQRCDWADTVATVAVVAGLVIICYFIAKCGGMP